MCLHPYAVFHAQAMPCHQATGAQPYQVCYDKPCVAQQHQPPQASISSGWLKKQIHSPHTPPTCCLSSNKPCSATRLDPHQQPYRAHGLAVCVPNTSACSLPATKRRQPSTPTHCATEPQHRSCRTACKQQCPLSLHYYSTKRHCITLQQAASRSAPCCRLLLLLPPRLRCTNRFSCALHAQARSQAAATTAADSLAPAHGPSSHARTSTKMQPAATTASVATAAACCQAVPNTPCRCTTVPACTRCSNKG